MKILRSEKSPFDNLGHRSQNSQFFFLQKVVHGIGSVAKTANGECTLGMIEYHKLLILLAWKVNVIIWQGFSTRWVLYLNIWAFKYEILIELVC